MWWVCLIFFLLSLSLMWYSYAVDPNLAFSWETREEQRTIETTSHSISIGNFEFLVPVESYLTYVFFQGSSFHAPELAAYLFLAALTLSAIVLLSVITTLSRFWYFTGMGLFILFLVSLRFDVLRPFGLTGQVIPGVIIVCYAGTSFYFHFIRSAAPFLVRLLSFTGITLMIGLLLCFFSGVAYPLLHLTVTGYAAGLLLTVLFIITVAHEIIASFIYLTSQGTSSGKSLRHFLLISAVYLVNLFLTYFHEAGIIHWDFIYVNLFLLLTISALLGIWGFKNREVQYQGIVFFYPFGGFFYLALGTIAFSTLGMLLAYHNDAALKVVRDLILFSHMGYGIIFITYIISNFILMLGENLPVHKILYQPNRMPYATYRIAGSIAMLAFVFYMDWKEYAYHSFSGFYNQLGALYDRLERPAFAEAYYQQARTYGFKNNHANYILADRAARRNDFDKALNHYELANGKRPTAYSFINEANLFMFSEMPFDAIHRLRRSWNETPRSPHVQNNLGFAYATVHKMDSALYFFEQARNHNITRRAAETNFLAFIGQEYLPIRADSVAALFHSTPAVTANALAIATLHRQPYSINVKVFEQPTLDLFTATRLNNYLVHQLKTLDSTTLATAYSITTDSVNERFKEALQATLAQGYYHQRNVTRAFAMLGELGYVSQSEQGKYNYLLGLWSLEQGCPELAISNFTNAVLYDYKEARVYNAIALAEAGLQAEARIAADSLMNHRDEAVREIARQLKKVLEVPASAVQTLNDLEKYQFCRYRLTSNDTLLFNRILPTFTQADYRAKALFEMAERQFELQRTATAIDYFTRVSGIPLTDSVLYNQIRHFELRLLASRAELRLLASQINEGIVFGPHQNLEKWYYTALLQDSAGDSVNAARHYQILAEYNPFFEDGVIAAARYFRKHPAHEFHAYTILVEAIQVNAYSYRLLMAYAEEAFRMGLDAYALDARQRAEEIRQRK